MRQKQEEKDYIISPVSTTAGRRTPSAEEVVWLRLEGQKINFGLQFRDTTDIIV